MDCEKCDSLLLDELYGELDDVASASVKKHLASCASCTAKLDGMRVVRSAATREVPPIDLEHAIMARVREAEKSLPAVAPILRDASGIGAGLESAGSQVNQATAGSLLSRAGRWAMRPQTAMAALLLVIVGTSTVYIGTGRSPMRRTESASAPVAMDQRDLGAAQPSRVVAADTPTYPSVAASAAPEHEARGLGNAAPRGPADPSAAAALGAPNEFRPEAQKKKSDIALDESAYGADEKGRSLERDGVPLAKAPRQQTQGAAAAGGMAKSEPSRTRSVTGASSEVMDDLRGQSASTPAPAKLVLAPAPPPSAMNPSPRTPARVAPASPAPLASVAGPRPADATSSDKDSASTTAMDRGVAAFNAAKFDVAIREFETAERAGSSLASLWVAKSVRAQNGCGLAAGKFDEAAGKLRGSEPGNLAILSAAECYLSLGNFGLARARFEALRSVDSYRGQAENGLSRVAAAEGRQNRATPPAALPQ